MEENNKVKHERLKKIKDSLKPLTSTNKKKVFLTLTIGIALILLTLMFLCIPFKNGSAFEILIDQTRKGNWDSTSIFKWILGSLGWICIVWNISTRIAQTIQVKKLKNIIEKVSMVAEFGQDWRNTLTYEQAQREIKKKMKKYNNVNNYIENFVSILIEAVQSQGARIQGAALENIREILKDPTISDKVKKERITISLRSHGIDITRDKIKKAINQV
ncbi:hypothetical protein [Mycoplasma sp. 392]